MKIKNIWNHHRVLNSCPLLSSNQVSSMHDSKTSRSHITGSEVLGSKWFTSQHQHCVESRWKCRNWTSKALVQRWEKVGRTVHLPSWWLWLLQKSRVYIYIYKTPRFHGYEKNAIRTSNFCKNSTNSESACFPRLLGDVRIEGAMGTHGTPSFFEGFWKL